MISVVTPTIRKEGLKIVEKALHNQTIQDFEWLIGSPFDPEKGKWVIDDFTGGYWTLNRILTKLCKEATGDLIVFLQDYIWIPPNGLEKFLVNWEATRGAISGVGDQYAHVNEYGKPYGKVWSDPRKTDKFGSFYECSPDDIELNWCAIGRSDIEKAGYFCDEADLVGYGADNVILAERLDRNGVKCYLDQANESFTLRHGRERDDWDKHYIMNTKWWEEKKYLSHNALENGVLTNDRNGS